MKIRNRTKISPIYVEPEDMITLSYEQEVTTENGQVLETIKQEVLSSEIGRKMVLDEAVIFDIEAGEFGENVKDGIGGALLSTKGSKNENS